MYLPPIVFAIKDRNVEPNKNAQKLGNISKTKRISKLFDVKRELQRLKLNACLMAAALPNLGLLVSNPKYRGKILKIPANIPKFGSGIQKSSHDVFLKYLKFIDMFTLDEKRDLKRSTEPEFRSFYSNRWPAENFGNSLSQNVDEISRNQVTPKGIVCKTTKKTHQATPKKWAKKMILLSKTAPTPRHRTLVITYSKIL
ncbi:hypothetical protein ACFE04_025385 [Oxalis oulophora]